MTLIITALSDDAVVQVSDRRLTASGKPLPKGENKAVCVSCGDTDFTFAFTGLAGIGTIPTADWVLDQLVSMQACTLGFPILIESLRARATATFRRLRPPGNSRGVTFVFAGLGPSGPFAALLSNMEDGKGNWLPAVVDEFQACFWLRNQRRMRRLDFIINGREDAVPNTIGAAINRVRKRLLDVSPERRAGVLVDLIRRAADHPTSGKYIGKDCMSVIVPALGDFVARYHPAGSDPVQYAPNLLTNGMAFKQVSLSLPPGLTLRLGGS